MNNNTGSTHYYSLQGSYWADQKDSHNEVITGAIKWSHEGIRYFMIKY